jgi:hypothetical protein
MALISLPVMMRYGYNMKYATGVLAASGTITQLVPPSLVLVVLADQLGRSVGDMYLGAWGPSIIQVFLFLFYTFAPQPLIFDSRTDEAMRNGPRAADYLALEQRFNAATASRSAAASVMNRARAAGDSQQLAAAGVEFKAREAEVKATRADALTLVRDTRGDTSYNDVNYVFPTFIMTKMPVGIVGLLIAAILAAAMSTISGELSALSTASVIDFYRRFIRPEAPDRHFLAVSRAATVFWGLFASAVAVYAAQLGSLATTHSKKFGQTEVAQLGYTNDGILAGLGDSNGIGVSDWILSATNSSACTHWSYFSYWWEVNEDYPSDPSFTGEGLIRIDPTLEDEYVVPKRYRVFQHYAAHIQPGAVRIDGSGPSEIGVSLPRTHRAKCRISCGKP